jgi:hypothetical protein
MFPGRTLIHGVSESQQCNIALLLHLCQYHATCVYLCNLPSMFYLQYSSGLKIYIKLVLPTITFLASENMLNQRSVDVFNLGNLLISRKCSKLVFPKGLCLFWYFNLSKRIKSVFLKY